jgi:hypothetical protein
MFTVNGRRAKGRRSADVGIMLTLLSSHRKAANQGAGADLPQHEHCMEVVRALVTVTPTTKCLCGPQNPTKQHPQGDHERPLTILDEP